MYLIYSVWYIIDSQSWGVMYFQVFIVLELLNVLRCLYLWLSWKMVTIFKKKFFKYLDLRKIQLGSI